MALSPFSGAVPALATLPYLQPIIRGARGRSAPGSTPGTLMRNVKASARNEVM